MQESEEAGGSGFYDCVYSAKRLELFFKALPHKVVGPGGKVAIQSDALWSVPEPELALLINPSGRIVGYTIGNDMSSRDIKGENLLYLPYLKTKVTWWQEPEAAFRFELVLHNFPLPGGHQSTCPPELESSACLDRNAEPPHWRQDRGGL